MRETKSKYFANKKLNNIADKRKFQQTVKPLFYDKVNHKEIRDLIDDGVTLSNDEEVAENFHIIVTLLKIDRYQKTLPLRSRQ